MNEAGFWRGYWPLLAAFGTVQLAQQADIIMMSRLGGIAPGAYVMLLRMVLLDTVLLTATGSIASTLVARARRGGGDPGEIVGYAIGVAFLVGLFCSAFGLTCYPHIAKWLMSDGDGAALIGAGVFWYSLSAPFRFVGGAGAFILHALGRGGLVLRWKLAEAGAKAAGNFLLMFQFGMGFAGCFASGAAIAFASAVFCSRVLVALGARWRSPPSKDWILDFTRSTGWESQRTALVYLGALTTLALFAAPWLGGADVARLNAYAAGQTLMLVLFAPLMALLRFLAFKLPALSSEQYKSAMLALWLQGAPVAVGFAALLYFVGSDWLGRLYGQQGPWWSTLIAALALSLPLRFAGNILRAIMQSEGHFSVVAAIDGGVPWLFSVFLVTTGLYAESPGIAYSSLVLPEVVCVARLWRRLHLSHRLGLREVRA